MTLLFEITTAVCAALWLRAEVRCFLCARELRAAQKTSGRAHGKVPAALEAVVIPQPKACAPSFTGSDQADFISAMKGMGIERREAMRRFAATSGPLATRIREALRMGAQTQLNA